MPDRVSGFIPATAVVLETTNEPSLISTPFGSVTTTEFP